MHYNWIFLNKQTKIYIQIDWFHTKKNLQRATELFFTKLPHHISDKLEILITSSYFVSSWLAKVNVKLVKANQTYMPSHRAFRSTISSSFGLILNHCF